MIDNHPVVSHQEWLAARQQLLAREKAFTRERDQLSAERRALPWEQVDKGYIFDTSRGKQTLADLFDSCSQLVIYHFMFGADWEDPCKSCSFWADNFNGIPVHLRHRDVTLIAVSSAPLAKIDALKQRMGWNFTFVSSDGSDFNHDYNVSFSRDELAAGDVTYNYRPLKTSMTELPGISVFYRDSSGTVFHTYSCYSRGLDMMNGAYHYLDLAPKGRDEGELRPRMQWVRLHDGYGD
jgi:predicted dithiol-disulfide oxidoreductase (DUF899 family)